MALTAAAGFIEAASIWGPSNEYRGSSGTDGKALDALADAQNRLTRALLIEPRNVPEIVELADAVRPLERQGIAAEV